MKTEISFDVSPAEFVMVREIVQRAVSELGCKDRVSLEMDLCACHANGNPLRFSDLLHADRFNFAHDIYGIQRHIDRETGEMTDFFSPRFSATP